MAKTKAIDDLRSPLSSPAAGMTLTEVLPDPPPQIDQVKETWASKAQKKKSLTKYEIDVTESEGKKAVVVPSEVIEKANPLWEDFVIARFLETAPHIAKVHMIVNKIWAFGD